MGRWHGEYRLIRDAYVEGPAGMVALSQQALEAAACWAQHAHTFVELTRGGRGHFRDAAMQAGLTLRLRRLQDDWAELRRMSAAVLKRGDAADHRLARLGSLPTGIVAGYAENTIFLLERGSELARAVAALREQAAGAQQAAWEATLAPMARAVAAAIRADMTLAPELAAELEHAAQAMAADTALYPHVAGVNRRLTELQAHVLARRYFRAREALGALEAEQRAGVATVRASGFDPAFQQDAVQAIDRAYASGLAVWRGFAAAAAPWQVVAAHLEERSRVLAAQCRDPADRPQRNCALLRQFIGLAPAQLERMDEAELALVEQSLERVEVGPLS